MRTPLAIIIIGICLGCSQQKEVLNIEGYSYTVKQYGKTIWMTENLKVTNNQLGQPITYFFPDSNAYYKQDYGLLYDFEVASKICPEGWKLPNDQDWEQLLDWKHQPLASNFKDTQYWVESEPVSNKKDFSVRPAGYGNNGTLDNFFGTKSIFWSSSTSKEYVWTFVFEKDKPHPRKAEQHPTYAFSVRCIQTFQ